MKHTLKTLDGKIIKIPDKCPFCHRTGGKHSETCFCMEMMEENEKHYVESQPLND